jgi:hypothetical protein
MRVLSPNIALGRGRVYAAALPSNRFSGLENERELIMSSGLQIFTLVHVAISLIGILTGLIVAFGMLSAKRLDGMTAVFLATTVLTSVTGYFFPYHEFKPSYAVGTISLIGLAIAIYARYSRRMSGGWRRTFVITAMIALYLNCFVLVAQSFMKVPALNALAPTGSEPPFLISQIIVMLIFIVWTVLAVKKFHPGPVRSV